MLERRLKLTYTALCSLLLLCIVTPGQAADGGWIGGLCESGFGTYRWTDGNRYEGE